MRAFLVILLVLLGVTVNTQSTFDYQKFLKTFNLISDNQFDYEKFLNTFFAS